MDLLSVRTPSVTTVWAQADNQRNVQVAEPFTDTDTLIVVLWEIQHDTVCDQAGPLKCRVELNQEIRVR